MKIRLVTAVAMLAATLLVLPTCRSGQVTTARYVTPTPTPIPPTEVPTPRPTPRPTTPPATPVATPSGMPVNTTPPASIYDRTPGVLQEAPGTPPPRVATPDRTSAAAPTTAAPAVAAPAAAAVASPVATATRIPATKPPATAVPPTPMPPTAVPPTVTKAKPTPILGRITLTPTPA